MQGANLLCEYWGAVASGPLFLLHCFTVKHLVYKINQKIWKNNIVCMYICTGLCGKGASVMEEWLGGGGNSQAQHRVHIHTHAST